MHLYALSAQAGLGKGQHPNTDFGGPAEESPGRQEPVSGTARPDGDNPPRAHPALGGADAGGSHRGETCSGLRGLLDPSLRRLQAPAPLGAWVSGPRSRVGKGAVVAARCPPGLRGGGGKSGPGPPGPPRAPRSLLERPRPLRCYGNRAPLLSSRLPRPSATNPRRERLGRALRLAEGRGERRASFRSLTFRFRQAAA